MKIQPGNVAVITGAGSGIGRALALNLASKGCILALADKNSRGLEETAGMISTTCSTHVLDVADKDAVQDFATAVIEQHGKVDILINNAGVALGGTVEQVSIDQIAWLFDINFWGVVHGVKAFLPVLKQQPEAHIVNLSSVFGLFAVPGQAAYCASKFAVRGFTETLRQELARTAIKVSCVHPGGIKTNIARNARFDAMTEKEQQRGRAYFERVLTMPPERAADIIVRGIERNAPRILIGREAYIMDFAQRLSPRNYPSVIKLFSRLMP
ncbi:SDR family NAD(P)-dependent oxidoreductase [Dictyobacter kobayashii]|uniref:Short-chain dehydrogenase n=1 Tax=Dictyobacter kobayashii TaxID=2014872 RepID=A0A402AZ40_9CHLR|nr:SDR family oxidoreductase [Dictyobacter kobayashii]GCE24381.1 short-chain dehydrogenase [Dictyobacter kobayashii]